MPCTFHKVTEDVAYAASNIYDSTGLGPSQLNDVAIGWDEV